MSYARPCITPSCHKRKRSLTLVQFIHFPGARVAKPWGSPIAGPMGESGGLRSQCSSMGRRTQHCNPRNCGRPTPNPLGTYGTHAESGFIAIMVILISTTYNNRSQPKYQEKQTEATKSIWVLVCPLERVGGVGLSTQSSVASLNPSLTNLHSACWGPRALYSSEKRSFGMT